MHDITPFDLPAPAIAPILQLDGRAQDDQRRLYVCAVHVYFGVRANARF
jgi:hypothetical protein